MSKYTIDWEEPRFGGEYQGPKSQKTRRSLSSFLSSRRALGVLVIILSLSLVGTTTIILLQNQQIQSLENQDYEKLKSILEEPLESPVTPTYSQVRAWLRSDNTNTFEYVEGVWACGDFSAMLMTRAKEMNWRMRICVIWYSAEGESGYGSTTDVYGSGGHTINMIECTDGEWYIEPQTDAMWYFTDSMSGLRSEFEIHKYYDFEDSDSGTIWDGYTIWTNFYGYFG